MDTDEEPSGLSLSSETKACYVEGLMHMYRCRAKSATESIHG